MADLDPTTSHTASCPFGRTLLGLATAIESLHHMRPGRGESVPPYSVAVKRLRGAFAKLEAVKPAGMDVSVTITVEPRAQGPVAMPELRKLGTLASLIDAIADKLVRADYIIPDQEFRRQLVRAFEGLNQTTLSGTGVSVSARVVYPRHRRESVLG
jgi:hypothetical protein